MNISAVMIASIRLNGSDMLEIFGGGFMASLLILLVVLAIVDPAHAGPLKEHYLGGWCFHREDNKIAIAKPHDECTSGDFMELTPSQYSRGTSICQIVSARRLKQAWAPATQTPAVPAVRVRLRCEGNERRTLTLSLRKGTLFVEE